MVSVVLTTTVLLRLCDRFWVARAPLNPMRVCAMVCVCLCVHVFGLCQHTAIYGWVTPLAIVQMALICGYKHGIEAYTSHCAAAV